MRCVATGATFLLHRNVLKNERSHGFGMAVGADRELAGRGAQLPSNKAAMRIVAIAAGNQTHIHAMPVWTIELGFLRRMTSVAQLRLLGFEQVIGLRGMMRRMAAQASDSILQVNGAHKVQVFQGAFVALQAALAGLLGGELRETNNLCLIAPSLHVRRSGPVAVFASVFASF